MLANHPILAASLLVLVTTHGQLCAQDTNSSVNVSPLAEMLCDRPEMAGLLNNDDVIVRWVRRRLHSTPGATEVRWDDIEPRHGIVGYTTDHTTGVAELRISNTPEVSGRDKWFLLVARLHKVMPAYFSRDLRNAARRGAHKSEFVDAMIDLELQRMALTKRFFRRYPIPNADAGNAPIYVAWMKLHQDLFDPIERARLVRRLSSKRHSTSVSGQYAKLFQAIRFSDPVLAEQRDAQRPAESR